MVGNLRADRFGAQTWLVAPLPAIVASANWGPRGDFSELMILSRSASGIAPPTVTASPSNSACDPGGDGTGAFCATTGADWMAPRSPAPMKYPRSNPSVISRAAPGIINPPSTGAGPPCSVLLGRICSAPGCVISSTGVAESRKLDAEARARIELSEAGAQVFQNRPNQLP